MSDTTVTSESVRGHATPPPPDPPAPPTPAPAPAATAAEAAIVPAAAPRSRAWVGTAVLCVVVALLLGATVALFVRVQEAQQTADDAVVLAGNQDALNARIDDLDATLASIQDAGSATADDVAAAREQVGTLRKCVNNAIDAWAQATQSGKPASITKC